MTKKPQTIQETPHEEKEDDSIEAHLRQHAREIANLKGQIAENDYKTETVQRQTAYLLHKNSKRTRKRRRRNRNACNNLWLVQGSHA